MKFLKKFNEHAEKGHLLYYAFDFDDNILNMPTEIVAMTKDGGEISMSTSDFAKNRSKIGVEDFEYNGKIIVGLNMDRAFVNFRDDEKGEIFKKDVIKALQLGSFGPAWNDFIECLTNGSIFAIITARGHESESMRKGIEYIIDNLSQEDKQKMHDSLLMFLQLFGKSREAEDSYESLSNFSKSELVKNYLDLCHLVGVSSPSRGGSASDPEASKVRALSDFIKDVNEYAGSIGYTAKVGFSDDDPKNIKHMKSALTSNDLNHEKLWPFVSDIVIIDTNKPDDVVKTNISTSSNIDNLEEFEGTLTETSQQSTGLESSVLTCTQFGNMTGRLNPSGPENRQDDFYNQFKRQVDYLARNSKEMRKEIKETNKQKKSSK
jgi:hypothetical protein